MKIEVESPSLGDVEEDNNIDDEGYERLDRSIYEIPAVDIANSPVRSAHSLTYNRCANLLPYES